MNRTPPGNAGGTYRLSFMPSHSARRSVLPSQQAASVASVKKVDPARPLLSPEEVQQLLNVPVSTLAVWRSTGRVHLPFVKVGRHVRYRIEDIELYLGGHREQVAVSEPPRDRTPRPKPVTVVEQPQAPKAFNWTHDALAPDEAAPWIFVSRDSAGDPYTYQADQLFCDGCGASVGDPLFTFIEVKAAKPTTAFAPGSDHYCLCGRCNLEVGY